MNLPTLHIESVVHIGTMRVDLKGSIYETSYEGAGLSVSSEPDAWEAIARLGGLPWWQLTNPDGEFLNALAIPEPLKHHITKWGLANQYVKDVAIWEVTWWDDELEEERYTLFTNPTEAKEEMEDESYPDAKIHKGRSLAPTSRLEKRILIEGAPIGLTWDHLLTIWTEDETNLDGVWWEEVLDPLNLSAPRGVILPPKVPEWDVIQIRP